jgi:RES domain/Antitoxin Xre-like helix-turn-helix domain
MTSPAVRTLDSHHINAVALDLLRRPAPSRRGSADPTVLQEWIEKRLASGSGTISGIELHREIEAGIPGKSIRTLIIVLDMTREDFSNLLGRARKTLGDLVQREHLSRVDSDPLYRIARAIVHAVSVFDGLSCEGARRNGGRWNSKGVAVLYCATSESVAMLELRVHSPHPYPRTRWGFVIEVPDDALTSIAAEELPREWDNLPPGPFHLSEAQLERSKKGLFVNPSG